MLQNMKARDIHGALIPFDIEVRSFNTQNKSGGSLIKYRRATLIPLAKEKSYIEKNDILVDPSHFENRTRNLRLDDGSVRKIHIDFVVKYNNKIVIY